MNIDWKDKPFVIGIAGGSASGKTTVSNAIYKDYNKQSLQGHIISIDDFYIPVTDEERHNIKDINFDDPNRIEFSELEKVLQSIIERKTTTMPIYDFKTCTRIGKKDISCKNIDFIIVEGLFCLYDERIFSRSFPLQALFWVEKAIKTGNISKKSRTNVQGNIQKYKKFKDVKLYII